MKVKSKERTIFSIKSVRERSAEFSLSLDDILEKRREMNDFLKGEISQLLKKLRSLTG